MTIMALKQLEYFMVTCEKGSFNKAAECLYTTQPNVSKVISSLEKELGRELFERTGKGIRITPYGETVQEYAQNILHNAGLIVSMADHNHGKKFSLATIAHIHQNQGAEHICKMDFSLHPCHRHHTVSSK